MTWKRFHQDREPNCSASADAARQFDYEIVSAFESLEPRLLLTVDLGSVPELESPNPDTTTMNVHLHFATFPEVETLSTWGEFVLIPLENFSRSTSDDPQPHEIALIERTHALVAEDFAPFPVNIITTYDPEDPPAPLDFTVYIGGNGEWFDPTGTARSAALPDTFSMNERSGFVFSDNLGVFPDAIGNEVSKVIGTALGLRPQHVWDDDTDLGPNQGFNTDDDQYVAPLMGNPSHGVTVWYNGTTDEGPAVFADELQALVDILDQRDQIGDTPTAGFDFELDGGNTMFDQPAGVISVGDLDYYIINTEGGLLTAEVTAPEHFNGDFVLTLFDPAFTPIMSADRVGFPDASLEYMIEEEDAGVYYLSVGSTGEYGRIGQYHLSGDTDSPVIDTPVMAPISGTIYKDANLSETVDPTDPGFEGVRVFMDIDRNGRFSPNFDPFTTTDENGDFLFEDVLEGTYLIGVDLPNGYVHSTALPETYVVEIIDETPIEDRDFALRHKTLQAEYMDVNDNKVIIKLLGKGNMDIKFTDPNNPNAIERLRINGSDRKSRLKIYIDGKKDAETSIQDIEVNGALKMLHAPNVDITDDLDVTLGARKIMIDDISGSSTRINLGQFHTRQNTKIIADQIFGTLIDSRAPIKMIKATEIRPGANNTPTIIRSTYVGKVITTGDKARGLAGDLNADFDVRTSGGFDFNPAVGRIIANGAFDFSNLDIIGGVRKIQGEVIGSNVNAIIDGILRVLKSRTNLAGNFTADNILRVDSQTQVGVNINLTDPQ